MNALLIASILLTTSAGDEPKAKLPIGKDTTFVTGPLDKHGYIDYEAALNAELSKGVTAENNANALLIAKVFGPAPEGGDGLPPEYFKWLGIPMPPKDGNYFIGIHKIARDQLGLTAEQMEALYEFMGRATKQPWAAKDCAPLAEWLKANEKHLSVVIEATKRTKYFNPLSSRRKEGESSNLISALLPSVQKCRELANALTCRAMLRVQEGKFDDAWADIIACHRLGRHLSHGATLIESLVAVAVCQIASNSTLAYLAHAELTSEDCTKHLKELQSLPALMPMADKVDIGERMMGLDALQLIRRGGMQVLSDVFGQPARQPTEEERKALEMFDWAAIMKSMNKHYDRSAAAMRMKNRADREKEFDTIEKELEELIKKKPNLDDFKKQLDDVKLGAEVGKQIGNILLSLLAPAIRKVQWAHDRAGQVERNLHIAFALAAYHKDNDRYPAKLSDLAPKYLKNVPDDIFTGKALIYKPTEKGYLFYSVGVNGKDDGGNLLNDDPPGDDLGVRMPPQQKK